MARQGLSTSPSKERRRWKPRDAGMRNVGLDPTAASCYLAMVLPFDTCELEATGWPGLLG